MRAPKPCDGTWQDYHRHKRRGEKACAESMKAHREKTAEFRRNQQKKGKTT